MTSSCCPLIPIRQTVSNSSADATNGSDVVEHHELDSSDSPPAADFAKGGLRSCGRQAWPADAPKPIGAQPLRSPISPSRAEREREGAARSPTFLTNHGVRTVLPVREPMHPADAYVHVPLSHCWVHMVFCLSVMLHRSHVSCCSPARLAATCPA